VDELSGRWQLLNELGGVYGGCVFVAPRSLLWRQTQF
jgi:hypothetical protein